MRSLEHRRTIDACMRAALAAGVEARLRGRDPITAARTAFDACEAERRARENGHARADDSAVRARLSFTRPQHRGTTL